MGLTATIDEALAAALVKNTPYTGPTQIWMSLHNADPGATGANEVTSGTGANSRQQVTFTGSGGAESNSGAVNFSNLAAGVYAGWVGFWTAQTGGAFLGGFMAANAFKIFTAVSGGAIIVSPGHGLAAGTAVRFEAATQQSVSLPGGLSAGATYYVIAPVTTDSFAISATQGGAAVANFSTSGGGRVGVDNSRTSQGTTDTLQFPVSTGITYSQT